ncbi:MAG: alpha/beta hydrolase [Armatimonadetes bacterium]|nr:alpha/beta hydrolase [Armatimonadota bacterium]
MLLDHPVLSERYFSPRPEKPPDPVQVRCPDGTSLNCYAAAGVPSAPTLLHFHGNGEIVADYVPDFAEAMARLGLNLFLAEYRGYGGSTGRPGLACMLADAEVIFQHLGLPPERVIVYGRSVGSVYAIDLAHRHPGMRGLVLESAIADPLERILLRAHPEELGVTLDRLEREVEAALDHQRKMKAFKGPVLIIHAHNDDLVDPSHASRLHLWAGGPDKELVLLPRGSHNSLISKNWERYLELLGSFAHRTRLSSGSQP